MQESSSIVPLTEETSPREQPFSRIAPITPWQRASLRAALPGLAMGGIFGLNEDIIKDRLGASASAVTATVYQGDAAAAEPVVAKSWDYMQRAHLHGGAIGTAAIGLIVVRLLIGTSPRTILVLSLALGADALGYSVYGCGRDSSRRGLAARAPRRSRFAGSRCPRQAP